MRLHPLFHLTGNSCQMKKYSVQDRTVAQRKELAKAFLLFLLYLNLKCDKIKNWKLKP